MDKKILTTHCDLVCLRSDKKRGLLLLGGHFYLKAITLTLAFLTIFAVTAFAGPSDIALKQAQDQKSGGNIEAALSTALAALPTDPENPKLNIFIGNIYLEKANYDSSLLFFNKVLDKKPKDPDALYGAGMSAYYKKDYDTAIKHFQNGEKTGKLKASFNYGLGLALLEKSDYQNADVNFRKAIDKDKKNPLYHLALADANYRNNTYSIAISEYNNAIALDSSLFQSSDIHFKIARSYFNMRNLQGAIGEFKTDLQVNPGDTAAWMELSRIYEVSGNIAEAVYCYEKYLAIVPANGQAWFDLSKLYLKVPDPAKAAEALEKCLTLDSHVAESYGFLAKIYADRKEFDKAYGAYSRYEAAFGQPDSTEYWFEKGKVMMKLGEKNAVFFDSAIVAFEKAVAIDAAFSPAFEYAGLTRYYQKQYPEAIAYFQKKIALDSTSINTFRNLAFSYLKTDQYSGAAKAFSRALELKPDDVVMRSLLAKIYSINKDYENSIKQYEFILNSGSTDVTDSIKCEIYPDLGSAYLQLRNCQQALNALLKAERCRGNDYSVIMNIAASYELCDKVKDANVYYKKALALKPNDKDAKKGNLRTTIAGQE
jgi:tetratricopeptide (TPR) repeat protein